ncbi:MAG: sigma factor [Bacillota bacterium]
MTSRERFEQNLRLAYYHGNAWARRVPWIDAEDIIQEALLGLWNAARAFDSSKGTEFASLARVCIDNQVRALIRSCKAAGQDVVHVSLNAAIADGGDAEMSLEDVLTRPQPLSDIEAEIRRTAPLAAQWFLDGYTQREIGRSFGFSKAYANSLIAKEVRTLREVLDVPMTEAPPKKRIQLQPCWNLRVEGESGPIMVRRQDHPGGNGVPLSVC